MREIAVPQTKPATEWVNGRALQKASPQFRHAYAQGALAAALGAWADRTGTGRVGLEWDFLVTPPGEAARPLVPDIAFLSYERIGYDDEEAAQIPYMAPDVAVEILSPGDRCRDIDEKIRVYLAAGAKSVVLIDPVARTFTAYDAEGSQSFGRDDTFSHLSLPGFTVKVSTIFEIPKPKS